MQALTVLHQAPLYGHSGTLWPPARSPNAPAIQLTRWRAFAVPADDGTNYGVIGTLQNQRFDFQTTAPAFGFNLYLPARNFTAVLKYLGTPSFELLCALMPAIALPVVTGHSYHNLGVCSNAKVYICDLAHLHSQAGATCAPAASV